jgi:hypothetical protein
MGLKKILSKTISGWRKGAPVAGAAPARASNRLMPLREAAQLAYDEADGTTFRIRRGRSPEEKLEIMATYLANNAPILGVRPPSEDMKPIAAEEFAKGTFKQGGNAFRRHTDAGDTYVSLSIMEADLRRVIVKMCSAG